MKFEMKRYEATEMTLGPTTQVAFKSNPIALPKRTCLIAFGPGLDLIVRVEDVDGDGVAHGHRLALKRRAVKKMRGTISAVALINRGLEAVVAAKGPLA